jgi:SHAQKYF class myb-like DNA-binding protein
MEEDMGRHPNFDQSEQEQCSVTSSRFELFSSKQPPAGAFLPFVGEQQVVTAAPPPSGSTTGTTGSGADLSLSSLDHVSSPNGNGFGGAESEVGSIDVTRLRTPDQILDAQGCNLGIRPQSNGVSEAGSTRVFGSQSQRKSRRCWTAELHRRFVGALQQLGGSQVATPKQIRELMKVDGLTNDEVKSHLQKYRLHTRRRSTSSQSVSLEAPQMVGMWVPVEYAVAQAAAQPTSGVYDPSPPSYCQPSHPQDYFTCNMSTGSSGGQLKQHPTTFTPQKSALLSQSSPQGPLQLSSQLSGGAQEVSIEDSGGGDVKSDSTSWKSCQLDDIEGKEIGRSIQHTVKQDNNGQQIKR